MRHHGVARNHARKVLKAAPGPVLVRPRAPRAPRYDEATVEALVFCWATVGAPTGKRLVAVLSELVPVCAGSVSSLADS